MPRRVFACMFYLSSLLDILNLLCENRNDIFFWKDPNHKSICSFFTLCIMHQFGKYVEHSLARCVFVLQKHILEWKCSKRIKFVLLAIISLLHCVVYVESITICMWTFACHLFKCRKTSTRCVIKRSIQKLKLAGSPCLSHDKF